MNYAQAFDIASAAIRHRENIGFKYPEGAARKAALAAVPYVDNMNVISVIRSVLEALEIDPRFSSKWDGSIG